MSTEQTSTGSDPAFAATTRTDAGEASTGQGRLAAAGQWVLNEKRLTERAGLDAIQDRLDDVWAGG